MRMQNCFGYARKHRKAARREFMESSYRPCFGDWATTIKGSGRNKVVLQWHAWEQFHGHAMQPNVQEIGDCIGQGFTYATELLIILEILGGEREQWPGRLSTEATYAGSRVEVGKGAIRRGDGSTGAWAAGWLRDYGTLRRDAYTVGNRVYDLRSYNPQLARNWGHHTRGVPDELEPTIREHPVVTTTLVEGYDDAIDLMANGYTISVCSNRGFSTRRDREGFLNPRGSWPHCMFAIGFDDVSDRKGVCIMNSWPESWVSGPDHALGQPAGAFWCDADVFHGMLRQGDSYALSGYVGYPARELDFILL